MASRTVGFASSAQSASSSLVSGKPTGSSPLARLLLRMPVLFSYCHHFYHWRTAMGFHYRKSVKLGKNFRLNFSKSGIGYSFGVKGFRYTRRANSKSSGCLIGSIVLCCSFMWWLLKLMFLCIWWMFAGIIFVCFVLPIKLLAKLFKRRKNEAPADLYTIEPPKN